MIPCSNPHAANARLRDEILDAIARVVDRGQYVLGPEVAAFEAAFASACGVEHAVGVNSGTDALTLTLRALDIGPGDEVITVSHTALATVAAVLATGATPLLVDVEPGYWTIDPAAVAAAITPRTRAIVPVHLYGQPAAMDEIVSLADRHGLAVIEDCAQATGATWRGRRVGSIGLAGCFSFYPTKNLGAIGDGGAVVTRDAALAERVRRLRQYGWDQRRETSEPGVNSRLDELQAAILNVKLASLDDDNARRRLIAATYAGELANTGLTLPRDRAGAEHVYHLYVVLCPDRDAMREALAARGVQAGVHYPTPAHRHPGYDARCHVPAGRLEITDRLCATALSLPIYPELTSDQSTHVASLVKACLPAASIDAKGEWS